MKGEQIDIASTINLLAVRYLVIIKDIVLAYKMEKIIRLN